jgi:hypothetical protein
MSRPGASASVRFERLLAEAMTAADPLAALEAAARDPELPEDLRQAFAAAASQPDGVRISALLVANLRFQRLLRGSPEADEWFERDPAGFTAAFRRYHAQVPPSAFFPPQEAELFRAWGSTEQTAPKGV